MFNNRGFRDINWPDDLSKVIWCIGDSFTVGLGQPWNETWPQILQAATNRRVIQLAMNGASNDWISKTAIAILEHNPNADIVLHWSFISRREEAADAAADRIYCQHYNSIKDPSWPTSSLKTFNLLPDFIQDEVLLASKELILSDENRLIHCSQSNNDGDVTNLLYHVNLLNLPNIIHSVISDFSPVAININAQNFIPEFPKLDLARDGFHYDIKTCEFFVDQILPLLNKAK